MVPEIWSETDRIFCHFGPLFTLLPTPTPPPPPPPPTDPKNQNFEKKMKKMPEDIILLYIHVCHK